MPQILFTPSQQKVEVKENTKILAAAIRAKEPIRYGCSACQCGTCAVQIDGTGHLSPMKDDERALLSKMNLSTAGDIRLSCQARIMDGLVAVDLTFQDTYSPDDF